MEVLDQMTDQELVCTVLGGNGAAYAVLCHRYESQLASMLLGRGVCHCDDIVQESFIKAYLNLEKYDSCYSFGQWIFAIAKNLHIDTLRKQKGTNVDLNDVVLSSGGDPETVVIGNQNREALENRLRSLPSGYREVVELRFLDELSYEEISQRMDIPIGTVKTKIHRARNILIKNR